MKHLKAVVLSPRDYSYNRVRDVVNKNLRKKMFEVFEPENTLKAGEIWSNEISQAIFESDLIVADISRKNPNVFYELGMAHALRKPTLLLLDSAEAGQMPFDLAVFQMVIYDTNNLFSLEVQMSRFLDYQHSKIVKSSEK